MKEHAAVAVSLALEPQRQMEILVALVRLQVSVFAGDREPVQRSGFDFPLLLADIRPAGEILAVEQRNPVLSRRLRRDRLGRADRICRRDHRRLRRAGTVCRLQERGQREQDHDHASASFT